MFVSVLKSKIHMAKVTDTELQYEGSIIIDEALLDAAEIIPGERVQVLNFENAERLETYVIPGKRGSGIIGLRGPAAKKGSKGDKVTICAYALVESKEAKKLKPRLVYVDDMNRIKK